MAYKIAIVEIFFSQRKKNLILIFSGNKNGFWDWLYKNKLITPKEVTKFLKIRFI